LGLIEKYFSLTYISVFVSHWKMKENIFLKNIFHKTKKILGFFYLVPHQTVYFKIPICPSNLWIEQQKIAKSEKGEHVSKIEHPP